jgi:hypothetical protein
MTYNSPKPEDLLAEDALVSRRRLAIAESEVRLQRVGEIFA